MSESENKRTPFIYFVRHQRDAICISSDFANTDVVLGGVEREANNELVVSMFQALHDHRRSASSHVDPVVIEQKNSANRRGYCCHNDGNFINHPVNSFWKSLVTGISKYTRLGLTTY